MKLNTKILDEFKSVDWFSKCGDDFKSTTLKVLQLRSWSEANQASADDSWIDLTEDAVGNLTEYLSSRHTSDYQNYWNKLVKEARASVDEIVVPIAKEVASNNNLGSHFVDAVTWDLLGVIMEETYTSKKAPKFFHDLWEVYRTGHFPCGLNDKGEILVF